MTCTWRELAILCCFFWKWNYGIFHWILLSHSNHNIYFWSVYLCVWINYFKKLYHFGDPSHIYHQVDFYPSGLCQVYNSFWPLEQWKLRGFRDERHTRVFSGVFYSSVGKSTGLAIRRSRVQIPLKSHFLCSFSITLSGQFLYMFELNIIMI